MVDIVVSNIKLIGRLWDMIATLTEKRDEEEDLDIRSNYTMAISEMKDAIADLTRANENLEEC